MAINLMRNDVVRKQRCLTSRFYTDIRGYVQDRDERADTEGVNVLQDRGTDRELDSTECEHTQPISSGKRHTDSPKIHSKVYIDSSHFRIRRE